MINEITIQNYKSIREVNLELGTVNVFIGENGAGKSNILEAIALAGAAHADKLDNEFLAARGVRMTSPNYMRSSFPSSSPDNPIVLSVSIDDDQNWTASLTHDNKPYSSWQRGIKYEPSPSNGVQLIRLIEAYFAYTEDKDDRKAFLDNITSQIEKSTRDSGSSKDDESSNITISLQLETEMDFNFSVTNDKQLSSFLIFSPEDSTLRAFEREGQIEPLGTRGEGLFKLLKVMSEQEADCFDLVQDNLELLGWFDRLTIGSDNNRDSIDISDIYLSKDAGLLDQRSANEGFLFLAFYFALFSSSLTPSFFAVDNIDASLNPRLCRELIKRLCSLAKQKGKQVILTSHNPAILDGLDLKDDQQRLFVIYRDDDGTTKSRRIENKPVDEDGKRLKLSEVFVRGLIGGLPKGF